MRKLYYEDSHLREFTATVTGCTEAKNGWEVTLDATAFYPEGGGQACDLGTLGNATVLDVQEQGEQVVHLCDKPLTVGSTVAGYIHWERRFDLMQQHSGEHILSGLIHEKFGYHNVGFHIGSDVMEVDFDGPITWEALLELEAKANEAIWKNLPIQCSFPAPELLPTIAYRSKKALDWPVRIVQVPGYDTCACCGVHVAHTGEVGLVKLFSAIGFRGGTRMEMACGKRALDMLNTAFDQNKQVSHAFSAQWMETGAAARRMNETLEQEKYRFAQLQKKILLDTAKSYVNCGDVLHFAEDLEPVLVRELADAIAEVCGGRAAVFSGGDGAGYNYALVARQGDLRAFGKEMTQVLNGRGGGKPNFQQGKVGATRAEIESFFEK